LNTRSLSAPPAWTALQQQIRGRWRALAPRERRYLTLGAVTLIGLLLWLAAIQPALRTVRAAPARARPPRP